MRASVVPTPAAAPPPIQMRNAAIPSFMPLTNGFNKGRIQVLFDRSTQANYISRNINNDGYITCTRNASEALLIEYAPSQATYVFRMLVSSPLLHAHPLTLVCLHRILVQPGKYSGSDGIKLTPRLGRDQKREWYAEAQTRALWKLNLIPKVRVAQRSK